MSGIGRLPSVSAVDNEDAQDSLEMTPAPSITAWLDAESFTAENEDVHVKDTEMDDSIPGRYGYLYLDSFMGALDVVLKLESHLFSKSELDLFDKFQSLSDDCKKLYVRLFMRRRNHWLRVSSFDYYTEIADLTHSWQSLVSSTVFAEQLDLGSAADTDEVLSLLGIEELKLLSKQFNCSGAKGTKREMMERLKMQTDGQTYLSLSSRGLSLVYDSSGKKMYKSVKLLRKSMELLGPCIKLRPEPLAVFDRVHLVFYRARSFDESSLRKLILARISKRNFPSYFVLRSSEVFRTRDELLAYEEALKVQDEVDQAFEHGLTPLLEQMYERLLPVYGIWQIAIKQDRQLNSERDHYLKRFTATYVHTRLVHKYAFVLSRLGRYQDSYDVYSALLAQDMYRQGKRGDWYQRKSLIENRYFGGVDKDERERKAWKRKALETCERGLQDPRTHLKYHYDLAKRIMRLERELRVLPRERHVFDHVALKEPTKRTFYGKRISDVVVGRKSIWLNDEQEQCSVEEMCLANYEKLGWRGYHTEGGILKTIFAYLFFDIIFLPVPFVFETEFQNAPLDFATDAFYLTRASEINHCLAEIENGRTAELIRAVYEREQARQTECVGLDWRFEIQDVLEAAECIGNSALSVLCRVFCEEYQHRGGGLPDLFLWKYDEKRAMFAEVKSENDRLSDTQRLWVDVLIGAGVEVELCAGLEEG
ncbi:hypothetical protein BZA70DRAFT_280571 [Myxozyma melibiosi]|uniref:Fanconi-associated nuclease n=1 Tax=Myxozyma melibiosi TaxID=54550 RepID=A0ABR1F3D8_9ASCO